MENISVKNIEREIEKLLDSAPMNCANLEKFVLLCKAMKYMGKVHREFTEEDAREWAESMSPPARWTKEQTTEVMRKYGYDHKPCEFWVVMNSLFSDYGKTIMRYGVDTPEFWAAMAHDWLADPDADYDKTGKYWRDIVKH